MKEKFLTFLKTVVYILLPFIGGGWVGVSCSESDDTVDQYENWPLRNNLFYASLEDSLKNGDGTWMKFKSFSKNPSTKLGANTDYIYVKVVTTGYEKASETESPLYNDSVRISYIGRLIPTVYEPEGTVFDSTVYGKYNLKTNATRNFQVSELVDGMSTALMHMHRFDTWRVYIPWNLGYGATASGTIPACSTLIFTMTLYDYAAEGHALPAQVAVD